MDWSLKDLWELGRATFAVSENVGNVEMPFDLPRRSSEGICLRRLSHSMSGIGLNPERARVGVAGHSIKIKGHTLHISREQYTGATSLQYKWQ